MVVGGNPPAVQVLSGLEASMIRKLKSGKYRLYARKPDPKPQAEKPKKGKK